MFIEKSVRKVIFSLIFTVASMSLFGESFRVSKLHLTSVEQAAASEANVRLGINDSVAIQLPIDTEYIEGLELKFSIPEAVAYWMDSVACSVYTNIKPNPKPSQIDYNGQRVFVRTLPNKLSWVLQIPLKEDNSIKSNNYTQKMDTVYNATNNIVFVRLQPVMKGVPEETLNAIIPITIKPILNDKGKLKLSLKSPENTLEPCSVFIDDEMISLPANGEILLPTGIHNISIISEAYRNEVRTVRIEQASETAVDVEMKSIEPTLFITAPEGTFVSLDEKKCNNFGEEFVIEEGEHQLKFTIGNYEMVRTINAIKGKTYKVTFSLDLQIIEE